MKCPSTSWNAFTYFLALLWSAALIALAVWMQMFWTAWLHDPSNQLKGNTDLVR